MKCRFTAGCISWVAFVSLAANLLAEPPSAAYIFPAGAQRGAAVDVRVGAHYLHDGAAWEMSGDGISTSKELTRTERIWFEGPLIRQPANQQREDYPQDYAARVEVSSEAPLGQRMWRAWNAQGVTGSMKFVVGDLPETIERETDGQPIPVQVALPITINGRIFPREDVDVWRFTASAGQSITCSVMAGGLGSPLEAQLVVRDASGAIVAESQDSLREDPELRFVAKQTGDYEVSICDSRFSGMQSYVYRLTITADAWIDRVYPLGGRRGSEVTFEVDGQQLPQALTAKLPDIAPAITSQAFAVNGKSTNVLLLDIDEHPELTETSAGELPQLSVPGIANGRIEKPGDTDAWSFTATKGTPLQLELRAARLGSPLDGVIVVKDADGKEVAKGDDLPDGNPDAVLSFTPAAA